MLLSQFQPDATSKLSAEERLFLLGAVRSYCHEHCPLKNGEGSCPLLTWHESVHTGALEKVCKVSPQALTACLRPLLISSES